MGKQRLAQGLTATAWTPLRAAPFLLGVGFWNWVTEEQGSQGPLLNACWPRSKEDRSPQNALPSPHLARKKVLFLPGVLPCFLNLQSQVSYKQLNHVHTSCIRMFKSVAFGPTLCGELSGWKLFNVPSPPFLCFQSASGHLGRRLRDPNILLSTLPYNGHTVLFSVIFLRVLLKSVKLFSQIAAFRIAMRETSDSFVALMEHWE